MRAGRILKQGQRVGFQIDNCPVNSSPFLGCLALMMPWLFFPSVAEDISHPTLSSHLEWRPPHRGEEPLSRDHPTIILHSSCKVPLETHVSSINARTHWSQQPMFLLPSPNVPSFLIPSPAHTKLLEVDGNNQASFQAWKNPVSRKITWGEQQFFGSISCTSQQDEGRACC